MSHLSRRDFIAASGAIAAGGSLAAATGGRPINRQAQPAAGNAPGDGHRGPTLIASSNGRASLEKAMVLTRDGTPLLEALVAGVKIVEDDPKDMSVGYGGLPNEDGVVQLDASVMDGRLHRAGSVGAIERFANPAAVALEVMRRTDHVMLVGEGASRFARSLGMWEEKELLTPDARAEWLKWKANHSRIDGDDWLNDQEREGPPGADASGRIRPDSPLWTWGTIHCSGVGADGNIAAVTSTSGLSYKLAGRLGDSPIVGAGMYCDNEIGSAGATGRGEAVIQVCGAYSIVRCMEDGLTPSQACRKVAEMIVERTREKRLLDGKGRPKFNVTLYAISKAGAFGSASLWAGPKYAVCDEMGSQLMESEHLFVPDP